jgi:hypothetical protein
MRAALKRVLERAEHQARGREAEVVGLKPVEGKGIDAGGFRAPVLRIERRKLSVVRAGEFVEIERGEVAQNALEDRWLQAEIIDLLVFRQVVSEQVFSRVGSSLGLKLDAVVLAKTDLL